MHIICTHKSASTYESVHGHTCANKSLCLHAHIRIYYTYKHMHMYNKCTYICVHTGILCNVGFNHSIYCSSKEIHLFCMISCIVYLSTGSGARSFNKNF